MSNVDAPNFEEIKKQYKKGRKRQVSYMLALVAGIIGVFIIAIGVGAGSPRLYEALHVITARTFPFLNMDPGSKLVQIMIIDLRLPRILLAIIAGAGLSASGATMQGVLRNPLVSSNILGISAAAGFGAALAIVFGIGIMGVGGYVIVLNAFIFGLIAMALVYVIARTRGMATETVILAGVAIGFLFSALLSLIQYIAPEHEAVASIVFWLMGSLSSASWTSIFVVLPIVVITVALMMQQSWNLNVMSMGEDVAKSLGVNSKRTLSLNMVLETLATASIIAFTGVIGFVDLVAPHITRMIIGNDHRFLIPGSMLMGAFILLVSDTVARVILAPAELPVGIVTALLGVPFFIYILMSKKKANWR
jgi:iron complex transport system permease protein